MSPDTRPAPASLAIGAGPATFFGSGSLARLPGCVRLVGERRAFVVTDAGLVGAGIAAESARVLHAAGIEHTVYADLPAELDTRTVEAGGRALREYGPAVVVGLGGGTAMDAAKGVALAATNDLPCRRLDHREEPPHPGRPLIAVPTTAGTGAETNGFAVVVDPETGRKFYPGHASVAPRFAILDPLLTLTVPAAPTAAAAFDALTHALESMSSRRPNAYAHALGLEVLRMVARSLPKVGTDRADAEARGDLLLAANLAGRAFATTGLGLCHAIAHALSARLGTAHGTALAVVLPHVLRFNAPVRGDVLAEVDEVLGGSAASWLERMRVRMAMPGSLEELGCTRAHIPILVEDALTDEVLSNAPRTPDRAELAELLSGAMAWGRPGGKRPGPDRLRMVRPMGGHDPDAG
jgi:alcohol dehydrogenase class IV